jgi:hypothetical protein
MSDDNKALAKAVRDLAKAHSKGMDNLSKSIDALTREVRKLGLAGAATDMGAIEALAHELLQGASSIAGAVRDVADKLPGNR